MSIRSGLMRIAFWIGLVTAGGCAKVGDPLPPVPELPPTISDLRIVSEAGGPTLIFRFPGGRIETVDVFRNCSELVPNEKADLIARLVISQLSEASEPGFFKYSDRIRGAVTGCRYAVRFGDSRGQFSPLSNFVSLDSKSP